MKTFVKNIVKSLLYKYKIIGKPRSFEQRLTKNIVNQRAFKEDPFFLLDVGASGGISYLWDIFGVPLMDT